MLRKSHNKPPPLDGQNGRICFYADPHQTPEPVVGLCNFHDSRSFAHEKSEELESPATYLFLLRPSVPSPVTHSLAITHIWLKRRECSSNQIKSRKTSKCMQLRPQEPIPNHRPYSKLGMMTGPYLTGAAYAPSFCTMKSAARLNLPLPLIPGVTFPNVPCTTSGSYATMAT